jgi:hypothetical protein
MGVPNAEQLSGIVFEAFGSRGGASGKQEATAAIGFVRNQVGLYVVKQGGPVSQGHLDRIAESWTRQGFDRRDFVDAESIVQGRYLAQTGRKLSEWTGYHAEMIILSAIISANAKGPPIGVQQVKTLLESAGGAVICANATACEDCGKMMDSLGIAYHGAKGNPSLTAWWNPLDDSRKAHT